MQELETGALVTITGKPEDMRWIDLLGQVGTVVQASQLVDCWEVKLEDGEVVVIHQDSLQVVDDSIPNGGVLDFDDVMRFAADYLETEFDNGLELKSDPRPVGGEMYACASDRERCIEMIRAVPSMLDFLEEFCRANVRLQARWEQGDLAGAVNELESLAAAILLEFGGEIDLTDADPDGEGCPGCGGVNDEGHVETDTDGRCVICGFNIDGDLPEDCPHCGESLSSANGTMNPCPNCGVDVREATDA